MIRIRDIPRTLKIRRKKWRVRFYRLPFADETPDKEILGCCIPSKRELHIKMGQSPQDRLSTLVHEFLHAVEYEYGIEIGHPIIDMIERPLADFIAALLARAP